MNFIQKEENEAFYGSWIGFEFIETETNHKKTSKTKCEIFNPAGLALSKNTYR